MRHDNLTPLKPGFFLLIANARYEAYVSEHRFDKNESEDDGEKDACKESSRRPRSSRSRSCSIG